MRCRYCESETGLSGGAHSNHVRWCPSNPKESQHRTNVKKRLSSARDKISQHGNQYTKAAKNGTTVEISHETREKFRQAGLGRTHSEETKSRLSELRKKWLRENPDAHPWKRNGKFKSGPCESLKHRLRDLGLPFEEEYTPLEDRAFSVDIAFPKERLAVEVNGEQHYNRDGTLRGYYRERHELIEKSGWTVVELHYAKCYEPHIEETVRFIEESLRPRMPPAF